jgi:CubicO group peptidase (beta-lactamase class C family)
VPQKQLAQGYRKRGNKLVDEPLLHHGIYGAMGGMITTIRDFSKYMAMHLNTWSPESKNNPVAKNASVREMHQPWQFGQMNPAYRYPSGRPCALVSAYGYGLGWTKDCNGRITVGHSGGRPGFGSNWTMLPEYGVAIVSFSNLTYAPMSRINQMILDSLVLSADLKPLVHTGSLILAKRKQQLEKLLPEWKPADTTGLFAVNFFPDNDYETLRSETKALFFKAGKIIKIHPLQPVNQLRGYFLMEGEKAIIRVWFTLTPEKIPLIQELRISEYPAPAR